jgi:hypothetical protein
MRLAPPLLCPETTVSLSSFMGAGVGGAMGAGVGAMGAGVGATGTTSHPSEATPFSSNRLGLHVSLVHPLATAELHSLQVP